MKKSFVASLLGGAAAMCLVLTTPDANACGGCFHEEVPAMQSPSVVTDHRMALAITPTMTTLWDQVEYVGDPGEFAWVLPIRGQVVVGVGSDEFLGSLDKATAPVVTAPPSSCAPITFPPSDRGGGCGGSFGTSAEDNASPPSSGGGATGWQEDSGVFVTNRSVVGPYETVQVHGKDAGGIIAWLRANRYHVDTELEPMLQQYVDEGFDFVAVRLRPNVGVNAMRPIRVSFKGAYPTLPLRMVRAGVGANVGIRLFVIADGRWRTQNFPTQAIDPAMLTWDFSAQRSNYTTVRDRESQKFSGRAFTIEASIDMSSGEVSEGSPPGKEPPPAMDSGTSSDAAAEASDAAAEASEAASDASEAASDASETSDASDETAATDADAEPSTDAEVPAHDTGSMPDYDAGAPPMVDPYAGDIEIAWGSTSFRRVTRLRADLPAKALDTDLALEADDSQATLSPNIQVTKGINEACPAQPDSSDTSDGCSCHVPESSSPVKASMGLVAAALAIALVRRKK